MDKVNITAAMIVGRMSSKVLNPFLMNPISF